MGRKSREKRERRELREKEALHGNQNEISSKSGDTHSVHEAQIKELINNNDIDKQEERFFNILNIGDEDDAEVNDENLDKYLAFLKEAIEMPCIVTGIEDMGCFGWEEYYIMGLGSKRKYDKLKMSQPSFRDKYKLLKFNDQYDEDVGLYVDVKRLSDKKTFSLPLADLKAFNQNSNNAQPLDDYSCWFENFR